MFTPSFTISQDGQALKTFPDTEKERAVSVAKAFAATTEKDVIITAHLDAETDRDGFRLALANAMNASNRGAEKAGGVRVTDILEDPSDLPVTFDPDHPDANELGYVEMPNVTLVKEITDAMAATQAYSANVTAFNTLKTVLQRSLEIGG
jgi:flagellar basal-body rod protein FlgC